MKTYKLEPSHFQKSVFQCCASFLLDGRLIHFEFGTPNFNDYSEWRLDEIKFSDLPYDPSQNDEGFVLKPIQNFPHIELTERELEWLGHFFSFEMANGLDDDEQIEAFNNKSKELLDKYPNSVNPFDYIGLERPLTSVTYVETPNEMTHYIYDETGFDSNNEPEYSIVEEVLTSDWEMKEDITHHHGLYNLLIPIMEETKKAWLSED